MKKVFPLILLLLAMMPCSAFAQHISADRARARAKEFFESKAGGSPDSSARKAMARRSEESLTLASQDSAYYVFNMGESQGFVIVSGEERATPVLGYSNSGSFDNENIPDGLEAMLKQYKQEIEFIASHPDVATASATSTENRKDIAPMLTTQWGQTGIYNALCPLSDGQRCVAGCVATALAQVMNYHQWPKQTTKTIPDYQSYTGVSAGDLPPITFDWEHMPSAYTKDPIEQKAVAELMLYCGGASGMQYGIGRSGTCFLEDCYAEYLDYSSDSKHVYKTRLFSSAGWEKMLYNELAHNRPVLYDASDERGSGGHCFVCDGYEGDGYFHFNFGWDGSKDGFYKLSAINVTEDLVFEKYPEAMGYNIGHGAVFGFRPNGVVLDEDDLWKEGYERDIEHLDADCSVIRFTYSDGNYWKLTALLTNNADSLFDGDIGITKWYIRTETSSAGSVIGERHVLIEPHTSADVSFFFSNDKFLNIFSVPVDISIEDNPMNVMLWTSPTTGIFVNSENTTPYAIPEDVLAVDLRNAGNFKYIPSPNHNCFYYLPESAEIPELLNDRMVVRGGQIESLVLTDYLGFTAPMEITAKNASFEYHFSEGDEYGTIILPFAPDNASEYEFYEFNSNDDEKAFFSPVSEVFPNTPYLIKRPEGIYGITFTSSNCKVKSAEQTLSGNGIILKPTVRLIQMDSVYVLEGNQFVYYDQKNIAPHKAYFVVKPNSEFASKHLQVAFNEGNGEEYAQLEQTQIGVKDDIKTFTRNSIDEDFMDVFLTYNVTGVLDEQMSFDIAMGLYFQDKLLMAGSHHSGILKIWKGVGHTRYPLSFGKGLSDGTYTIKTISKVSGSADPYLPCLRTDSHYIKAVIKGNTLTLTTITPEDFNGDGTVSIGDVTSLIQAIINGEITGSRGEILRDGVVNKWDVEQIRYKILR